MSTIPVQYWHQFEALPNREVFKVLEYEYGRKVAEDVALKVYRQAIKGNEVVPADYRFAWPSI